MLENVSPLGSVHYAYYIIAAGTPSTQRDDKRKREKSGREREKKSLFFSVSRYFYLHLAQAKSTPSQNLTLFLKENTT